MQLSSSLALCLGIPAVVAGRCSDARMAHYLLDRSNVGTRIQQVAGERAAQIVGRELLDACFSNTGAFSRALGGTFSMSNGARPYEH